MGVTVIVTISETSSINSHFNCRFVWFVPSARGCDNKRYKSAIRNSQFAIRNYSPDFVSGTVSINLLITWSVSTFSDSAWKLSRIRCRNTGSAMARISSQETLYRLLRIARAFPARTRNWDARSEPPQVTQRLMKSGAFSEPGRLAPTRLTAYRVTESAAGTFRTKR